MKWDVKYLLTVFLIMGFIQQAKAGKISYHKLIYKKLPKQVERPQNNRQIKLYNDPFIFFEDRYSIPKESFNEMDLLAKGLAKALTVVVKDSESFQRFVKYNRLPLINYYNVSKNSWSSFEIWFHISNEDINKLIKTGLNLNSNYLKELFNVLEYKERLTFKLIALLQSFTVAEARLLLSDLINHYGMKESNNAKVYKYIFDDIYQKYFKNQKYIKKLLENSKSAVRMRALNDWKTNILKNESLKTRFHKFNVARAVNSHFNRSYKFKSDQELWGVEDYHATPYEFIMKGIGDCEDFAYAKFVTLLGLGFNYDEISLRYVVHKRQGAHMVAVFKNDNGEEYILDNMISEMYNASEAEFTESVYEFDLVLISMLREAPQGKIHTSSHKMINDWKLRFLGITRNNIVATE